MKLPMSKFYDAWHFLLKHRAFHYPNSRLSCFEENLLIEVVKVGRITKHISKIKSLNTMVQVWLECGPYEEENGEWGYSHDPRLNCGASTFEEAIIKLSKLVRHHYGNGEYTPEEIAIRTQKTKTYVRALEESIERLIKEEQKLTEKFVERTTVKKVIRKTTMRKEERAIQILKDAESVFREPPAWYGCNISGLCLYVKRHQLLSGFTPRTKKKYLDLIFKGMTYDKYLFVYGNPQISAWERRIPGYDTERADFCKKRIEELKEKLKEAN